MSFPRLLEPAGVTGANGFRLFGAGLLNHNLVMNSAGDVNGDGIDDIAVGASWDPLGPGAAFVVFGRSGGFEPVVELGALAPGTGLSIRGVGLRDGAGYAVSGAGDVNGDGYGDLLVAAMWADLNGTDSGAAYLLFGGPSLPGHIDLATLNGANGMVIPGAGGMDLLNAVASAGDFNGDGFGDLIVGAAGSDLAAPNAGAAYVIYGRPGGFPATLQLPERTGANGFRFTGLGLDEWMGAQVEGVGDVNGDGFGDVLIPPAVGGADRAAYLLFGHAGAGPPVLDRTQLNGANGVRITTSEPGVTLTNHISSRIDFNGDGYADLALGARAYDGEWLNNIVYVVFGHAGGFAGEVNLGQLDGLNGFKARGPAYYAWDGGGMDVESAGDVNGDGFEDLLLSSAVYTGGLAGLGDGEGYVLFGRAVTAASLELGELDSSTGLTFQSTPSPFDGFRIGRGGDFNGDGLSDILIGEMVDRGEVGSTYVLFGERAAAAAGENAVPDAGLSGAPHDIPSGGNAGWIFGA